MLSSGDKDEMAFDKASRIYSETGDSTMAEDIGLMDPLPRRMWHYAGRVFHVVRESENEAYLGLRCPTHFHKVFYINPPDEDDEGEDPRVLLWRLGEGETTYGVTTLQAALELGADLLAHECPLGFKRQLDGFFEVVEIEEWEKPWF